MPEASATALRSFSIAILERVLECGGVRVGRTGFVDQTGFERAVSANQRVQSLTRVWIHGPLASPWREPARRRSTPRQVLMLARNSSLTRMSGWGRASSGVAARDAHANALPEDIRKPRGSRSNSRARLRSKKGKFRLRAPGNAGARASFHTACRERSPEDNSIVSSVACADGRLPEVGIGAG